MMELMKIFHKVELEGGQATLSATTHEGKTKLKLEIVSPPSATAPPSSPPAPGRRRRHRGARARARRNQRAAAHQAEAVLRWPPLSASFPRHLLIRGGVRCCPVGRGCRPSPTWMVLPPLLLLPHQHQHHLHLCPHHLLHSHRLFHLHHLHHQHHRHHHLLLHLHLHHHLTTWIG